MLFQLVDEILLMAQNKLRQLFKMILLYAGDFVVSALVPAISIDLFLLNNFCN